MPGMSTQPQPHPKIFWNRSESPAPLPSTIFHAVSDPATIERFKAEHAAKMRESAMTWPGRKRAKRRRR
jgi:hypothetical protein